MLKVDDSNCPSAAQNRHGEKRFVPVLRQFTEEVEAGIAKSIFAECNRFEVLGNPSGDALPNAKLEAVYHFRMRILRRAQNEFIALQNVDEARVALDLAGDERDNSLQDIVQHIGACHAAADLVQQVYSRNLLWL